MLNVYVDDELYVRELTPAAERYATFQKLRITEVGNLAAWLDRPPTKLVSVADSDDLDILQPRMKDRSATACTSRSRCRSFSSSLRAASPRARARLPRRAARLLAEQTVAFGDGENDVELLEWAGYGVAVANAHERLRALADLVCPPADEEGVAQVIEAVLDSRS